MSPKNTDAARCEAVSSEGTESKVEWDTNQHLCVMLVSQAGAQPCTPQCWPHERNLEADKCHLEGLHFPLFVLVSVLTAPKFIQ